jgi:PAS domain S-box-containing protein
LSTDNGSDLSALPSRADECAGAEGSEHYIQRYKFFFQHARDIIHFLDKDGRVLDANEAAVTAYQYSLEELLTKTIFDLRSPESSPMTTERVFQEGEKGLLFEAVHLRKDGTTFPVEVSARAMKIDGELMLMNIVRDITLRKEAERILQESEERYRHLFECSPLPMCVYDIETLSFLAVNEATIRKYGYTNDEFLSMTIKDISPSEDAPDAFTEVKEERPGLETVGVVRHRKKDGSIIYVSITTYDIIFAGRKARLGLAVDVTAQRNTEIALRSSEDKFRTLFESAPAGMITFDRDGVLLQVNRAMEEFTGYSRAELLGRTLYETVGAWESPEKIHATIEAVFSGEAVQNLEFQSRRRNGSIAYALTTNTPIYGSDGSVMAGLSLGVDITNLKMAEEKQRQLDDQKREFYQRTILAATEGKLVITDTDQINRLVVNPIESWNVESAKTIGAIRGEVARIALSEGMDESRISELMLGVGESAANAVKHAGGGVASLCRCNDALLFVMSDNGPGIAAMALPDVALTQGYTTVGTLGMGYKLMIRFIDKIYLSTGPEGTKVALEMSLHEPAETTLPLRKDVAVWTANHS